MTIRDAASRLAKNMKAERVRAGYRQEDVANYLGCSRVRVVRIESGEIQPKGTEIWALAELYGIPAGMFYETVGET